MRIGSVLLLSLCLSIALFDSAFASAPPKLDWPIANGHFFTQANGAPVGSSMKGFAVTDDAGVSFLTEYWRLGGPETLGYPVSQRFTLEGSPAQAVQKGILVWDAQIGTAYLLEVMDRLHDLGKDGWLRVMRLVPEQTLPVPQDASVEELFEARLALLDEAPAIKDKYLSSPDPLATYGLPTSRVVDVGPAYAVRFQRTVLQQWKQSTPWASKGEVTTANVGDLAKEAGLVPTSAAAPADPPPPLQIADPTGLLPARGDLESTLKMADPSQPSIEADPQAGRYTAIFGNKRSLTGPFAAAAWVAGYHTAAEASRILASLAAEPPGEPVDPPQMGDEALAFWAQDPAPESTAIGKMLVWRRGAVLLAVGAAGFTPTWSPPSLDLLAGLIDRRASALDGQAVPASSPAAPGVSFDSLFALRPEPLGSAATSLAGSSADRTHNLLLAASGFNDLIVEPGQVISFNEVVGPTTLERGYRMGYAILGEDTVPDVGGGICQVSTTLFQSVFFAGLPVVERWPHAYWISRYRVRGLDATVFDVAGVDFKFKNDMDRPLLVQAKRSGDDLHIALYSESARRQVIMEGPFIENVIPTDRTMITRFDPRLRPAERVQVEVAQDGMDVTVGRIVLQDGQELSRSTFVSHYRPAHNVVLVGSRPPTPTPIPQPEPTAQPG